MDELFGAPVSAVAMILGVLFAVLFGFLGFIAIRDKILIRMAIRNVARRPARSALIIVGLMLATAIIASAFTTGDSITFSIKRNATDSLRNLDELIRVDRDSDVWEGKAVPDQFPESVFQEVAPLLDADPDIDGALPVIAEPVSVANVRGRQFEVNALLVGADPGRAPRFEALTDVDGNPADLASLAPDEVYIDSEGAEKLDARRGDTLGVALGPGELHQFTVKAIVDGWYFKQEDTAAVLTLPLGRVQELLDRPGLLTGVLISNRGDAITGVDLTDLVVERVGAYPAIAEAGLEVFDLKREVVDQANAIGSLFVSFFTTFGLFSIGVGLLLIFLIFSMLAAERKGEMGVSRAVGMQRKHLVRLFIAEGAIYGIGSAAVGSLIGVGLGLVLVRVTAGIFSDSPTEEFVLTSHVEPLSVATAFLFGSIITFVTVIFAARRTSRLNIVRAIRDIPEPQLARAGKATLIWGIIVTALGGFLLFSGFRSAQATAFFLGLSLVPMGLALILRWRGVAQRVVLSGTGLILLAIWLMPPAVYLQIKEDWNQDFTGFFVAGALSVTGGVLVTVNNSGPILAVVMSTFGRFRRLTPIIKSAVSYPLRFGFRTGLSVAMFAVVIFSVTVMSTLIEGFNALFDDQQRLAGGYDVIGFTHGDLNPIVDLRETVGETTDLQFVSRVEGEPSVGTFRTIGLADARLSDDLEGMFEDTLITGFDDDFVESNLFEIKLATQNYATPTGFDAKSVWEDLRENPGLAVVNALMVPTRNGFAFNIVADRFSLNGVDGLFLENESMEPIVVTVRDLESAEVFDLTIVGVLDDIASSGPFPAGFYTSTNTFGAQLDRDVSATQFFFNTDDSADDGAKRIEAALFRHGVETLDVPETLKTLQASQRSFFNLLIGFMTLGLVVGIAGLGVISARAVVERRHEIGVMRAIGFSRPMVQASFLAESFFISAMGIGLGLMLGLITAVNVMSDIRTDEPNIQLIFPWATIALIGVGASVFSLAATFLPALQAARIAPAEALRYE